MTEQDRLVSEIVDWYYNSSEQVFEYSGPAGTGKSFVMKIMPMTAESQKLMEFLRQSPGDAAQAEIIFRWCRMFSVLSKMMPGAIRRDTGKKFSPQSGVR